MRPTPRYHTKYAVAGPARRQSLLVVRGAALRGGDVKAGGVMNDQDEVPAQVSEADDLGSTVRAVSGRDGRRLSYATVSDSAAWRARCDAARWPPTRRRNCRCARGQTTQEFVDAGPALGEESGMSYILQL